MRHLIAAILLVGFASAAPVPKALKKQDETALLVGRWKPVGTSRTFFDFRPDGTMRCWTDGNERSAIDQHDLQTTARYTRVGILALCRMHAAFHPAEQAAKDEQHEPG